VGHNPVLNPPHHNSIREFEDLITGSTLLHGPQEASLSKSHTETAFPRLEFIVIRHPLSLFKWTPGVRKLLMILLDYSP